MKKTIQLKESDIKRMVMEAVNELDWQTYANAARKRALKDKSGFNNNEKVRALDRAASDALNAKFPPKDPILAHAQIKTDYDDTYGHSQKGYFPSLGQRGDFNDTFYTNLDNPEDNWEMTSYYGDRTKEMSDFFKGRSKYVPGKGWITDNALEEAIRRTLCKYLR